MKVEVVMAWPRQSHAVQLELADGATVADALSHARLPGQDAAVATAIHGVRAEPTQALRDGDRVELLRPLQADPKEARRRRAAARAGR